MKINLKSFLITFLIIMLFLGELLAEHIKVFSYVDEVICLLSVIFLMIKIITKKKLDSKSDTSIIIFLIIIVIVGVIGNFISKLENGKLYIIIDIISTVKAVCTYMFVKNFLTVKTANKVSKNLFFVSKFFIIVSAVFAILSQFTNLHMTSEVRYGIRGYTFIFAHQHMLAGYIMTFLLFIVMNEKKNGKKFLYTVLAFISQIMTTKGPSIIWCVLILLFYRYFIKRKKISKFTILGIIFISIVLGQYQIKTYLMNEKSPRAIFYKYGIITTKEYFPFGAGFSTYGSQNAKLNYSKLYIKYGFNEINGMTKEYGPFLNDNYWPMLLGQVGFICTVMYLIIFIMIFKNMQKKCSDRYVKAIVISNYIYIMIHSLGSAIITSSVGVLIFMIIGIYESAYENIEKN